LATLVEDDDAGEGRESLQQVLVDGEIPVELDVGKRAWDENEIARPLAKDSVGDVDVAGPRVFDVALHGRCLSHIAQTGAAFGA
jgi:hypothetical protein